MGHPMTKQKESGGGIQGEEDEIDSDKSMWDMILFCVMTLIISLRSTSIQMRTIAREITLIPEFT